MLVKIRNWVIETKEIYMMEIDTDKKSGDEHLIYTNGKCVTFKKDEYDALLKHMSRDIKVLL